MRKITEQSARAFMQCESLHKGNMMVSHDSVGDHTHMYLHGNCIAQAHNDDDGLRYIKLSDCGWQTVTTKERLNGLLEFFAPGCRVYQRDYRWYLATPHGDYDWFRGAIFRVTGELVRMTRIEE